MADGHVSSTPLMLFLYDEEERIVNEITARVRASSSEHYRIMETIDLRPRMQALYEAFRESAISGDRRFVAASIYAVGRKRLQQEYGLDELLSVMDALAAVVWETAAAAFKSRGAEAFDDLHRLAEAALWTKDSLAGAYAEEMKQERESFGRLNKAFSEYLKIRYTENDRRRDD
jgi:hypothetical protein